RVFCEEQVRLNGAMCAPVHHRGVPPCNSCCKGCNVQLPVWVAAAGPAGKLATCLGIGNDGVSALGEVPN
ncbi:MAG: hypothetical protein GY710_02225, partial [Desulfobacteraceae bacterium]|nr:hypothetical protein [Desulfobacteraceae bacterium]